MFLLRDILTADFSSWAGQSHILDDVTLPKWLDRRWRVSERRDRRRFLYSEGAIPKEPLGKDASKDW